MPNYQAIQPGCYYHIYNRGNNGEDIFIEERNYLYFLNLYKKYLTPIAETFAYCLLPNHFHLLIRIKDLSEFSGCENFQPGRAFAGLFGTYAKGFNTAYERTGSVFEKPFRRKMILENQYLYNLVIYIHFNPQRHGLINDFREWPYSSYKAIAGGLDTKIRKDEVLGWFGGQTGFVSSHLDWECEPDLGNYKIDSFE